MAYTPHAVPRLGMVPHIWGLHSTRRAASFGGSSSTALAT
ncbi:hypothetical protein AKJ09_00429 [Labilithrix luteola]|uniref:Uncharacterized protein n=1 Tax=Labilithrix luteola TaxID=1391654 RepID=A0A0K1PJS1_9BACT|nr:hypothetical protein AKJ09_00429 [Labilithrix luteola]